MCCVPSRFSPVRLFVTLWTVVRQVPWESPGKNTGVACHYFLQVMFIQSPYFLSFSPHHAACQSLVSREHMLKSLQLCPALCNPMDYSSPDSSVQGILQARIQKWVAMPSSRGSSQPRDRTHVSYVTCIRQAGSLPVAPPGKPMP